MSARIIFAQKVAVALFAARALGCGSRSALEWKGVDGEAFRDASLDVLADRSVDVRQEGPVITLDASQPIDAGPPIDANPRMEGPETEITLFGGSSAHGLVGDTWTWDGHAWRKQPATGPSARYGPAMALLHGKNVLFGGAGDLDGSFTAFDQTYEWDGTSWSLRKVAGPAGRWVHAMATLNDKIVLFGGFDGHEYLGDTWEWDGDTWTQRMVEGPPARARHAMATVKGKVVLFAGQSNSETFDDTWEWDGDAWTKHDVSPAPGARTGHAMASLPGRAVLIAGGNAGEYFDETWEWDGRSWTERNVKGPSSRAVPAMAALQGKVLLFGGVVYVGGGRYEYLTDTWEWDGNTWTDRGVSGPIGVSEAAMSSR